MTPEEAKIKRLDENVQARLLDIAHAVNERLPAGCGFIVLAFQFGPAKSRVNYISNAKREDAINSMKEFMIKAGAFEDWMKHLP